MEQIGIELEQAIEIILQNGNEITRLEQIETKDANGRILAEDIVSPFDVPPFNRSPLDGFALRSKDLVEVSNKAPKRFKVVDTVYAGDVCNQTIQEGEAVRIMTGAAIPDGADCVIRLEDVIEKTDQGVCVIIVDKSLKQYENFCFQGEDIRKDSIVLRKGQKLTYIEQGIIASLGIEQVKVYDTLKVAVFATGDELMEPGTSLEPGKIFNSNLHMLYARLQELGIRPMIAEHLKDDPIQVAKKLVDTCKQADLVVTTGGVSVGDKDIFHKVLQVMGAKRLFWRVNLKPGTPAMFALYEGTPMFHLSGNPFAAITTFELLVRPYIAMVSRREDLHLKKKKAILQNEFIKESKGRRFIRGKEENGFVSIPPTTKHSSGILGSMIGCNCLIDIPKGSQRLQKGDQVQILLL